MSTPHIPEGHPYSTVPSAADIDRALAHAAQADPAAEWLGAVPLRTAYQFALLGRLAAHAEAVPGPRGFRRFTMENTWFTGADALLFAFMLREFRPPRVVEVGCGFSTALALDIDEEHLSGRTAFTFIEPDATRLKQLVGQDEWDGRLVERRVQDAPRHVFTDLRAGDFLLIDGSHVLKAGSDVQYLFGEVLPVLAPGVLVHIHDVFWPFEYPRAWLTHGFHPNEAYALRLLLTEPALLRIELFIDQLRRVQGPWLDRHLPEIMEQPFPTGGIWLSRT